jgi:hypothetical protein
MRRLVKGLGIVAFVLAGLMFSSPQTAQAQRRWVCAPRYRAYYSPRVYRYPAYRGVDVWAPGVGVHVGGGGVYVRAPGVYVDVPSYSWYRPYVWTPWVTVW